MIIFLAIAMFAIGSIVVPASDWVAQVPGKIAKVRAALEPVFDLYKNLDRFIDRTVSQIAVTPGADAGGPDRDSQLDARAARPARRRTC